MCYISHVQEKPTTRLRRIQRKRIRAIEFLENLHDCLGCRQCGSFERLNFDHIDPKIKAFKISGCLGHRWGKVQRELRRCPLLCEDCHKKKTKAEKQAKYRCGTRVQYERGCRCSSCKAVSNAYQRKRYYQRSPSRRSSDRARQREYHRRKRLARAS